MTAVSFQSISKTYTTPRGDFHALQDVSLDIEEGEFFGLLGPNGAGKTTLISILAGLARASSGRVTVLGHDVQGDFAAARQRLGIVPQELVFDPFFNVRETLRIQSGYFGIRNNDAWIDELLENLGLADKAKANMRTIQQFKVRLKHADGQWGLPEAAPFDTIILAAAAAHVPQALLQQLALGGRMLMPLGAAEQHLLLVERRAEGFVETRLDGVRFVPLLSGVE